MADILICCRDGVKQSLIANLALATFLKKERDKNVVLLFVQEALLALAKKEFTYRGLLEEYTDVIDKTINDFGFPPDPLILLKAAKEVGVTIVTCSVWAKVVQNSKNIVPCEIDVIEVDKLFDVVLDAKKFWENFKFVMKINN